MNATAIAHPNIALIKYWGKRDKKLNLPAVGSISITLDDLFTETTVSFKGDSESDCLILNGRRASRQQENRVSNFLNIIRRKANIDCRAEVVSRNNFPTGAGLASSASAFASLALAGSQAAGLSFGPSQLSELARRGSGSAARSIFGGFVEMIKGEKADGSDAVAVQLAEPVFWELNWLVIITTEEEKKIGSTDGMSFSEKTSPYYPVWIDESKKDIDEMRSAILNRDFPKMGDLMEFNCMKMHALTLSSRPPVFYWNEVTLAIIHLIQELRLQKIPVYYTIDAGPQVKAICRPNDVDRIKEGLETIPGIKKIIKTGLGQSARLIEDRK